MELFKAIKGMLGFADALSKLDEDAGWYAPTPKTKRQRKARAKAKRGRAARKEMRRRRR